MKLQVALDYFCLEDAIRVLDDIHPYIDIAEIGTPLVLHSGVAGVQKMRERYPNLRILADLKIMDGGFGEADMFYKAGADIVTVMGIANTSTVEGVVKAAQANGKKSFVDMMVVPNLAERARELEGVGADIIGVHTAFDVQKTHAGPFEDLKCISEAVTKAQTAVAGGIKLNTIKRACELKADVIIVGGAIVNAEDKVKTIHEFRNEMKAWGGL